MLMIRSFTILGYIFLIVACNNKQKENTPAETGQLRMYAPSVNDSFSVFVNLPPAYNADQPAKYPVVYLLDANLYFDIMATTLNKYAEVGLAPSVILVGVGYKNFPQMDSLRNRDYTYPVAIPEYEMSTSGGADKFLSFIHKGLVPYIDSKYRTDTVNRILMGHSLGGYFTLFSLMESIKSPNKSFTGFIAASPSLHYNNYYLLNQLSSLHPGSSGHAKVYIAYGGLEDSGDPAEKKVADVMKFIQDSVSTRESAITYKTEIYSTFSHMETQIPAFIKGLQWALVDDK